MMLKAEDLNVYYGPIHAVKGVSFEVREGEIVTLIGANGAGKSTTLKTLSGLMRSRGGKIEFMDKSIASTAPHKIVELGLAQVPEGRRIFTRMTVEENLDMGAFIKKNANVEADKERVFEQFPRLKERRKQVAGTLSGGEQQMLAMGRALMSDPKLLMLDEPSMGLAPILVEQVFDIITELHKAGTTILLVEQNAEMALSIADRAYVMEMMLSLCACGSSNSASSAKEARGEAAYYAPEPAMPMAAEAAYDMAYEESGMGMANTASAKTSGSDTPAENPEKIIYSADATVETTEFDQCLVNLDKLLAANGGFVESSSVNGSNYYDSSRGKVSRRTASYTLRIPSANFGGMMDALSTLGNVPYTHMYTENVTAQYYDVEARMKAYQKQEQRLLEMMDLAETVEDIITIEDKLTDVRYRIDSLQSSLNNWDRRVSYSTLSLTVQEVQVYTPEAVTKITYGQRLANAFKDSLKNAGEFFQDLLVFLVSALPTLVILAVLFFVLRPLLKKLHARGKARRAKRAEERAAKKALKEQAKKPAPVKTEEKSE